MEPLLTTGLNQAREEQEIPTVASSRVSLENRLVRDHVEIHTTSGSVYRLVVKKRDARRLQTLLLSRLFINRPVLLF